MLFRSARGKAAVAAYLNLVPEFEKSIRKSIAAPEESNVEEIVFGEVVEDE